MSGKTVLARIDDSHVRKHTEHLGDFPDAVRELIWNGVDAGASQVVVTFVKNGGERHLTVLDNGDGITDEGLEAMASLDFSPSADDPSKRGRNGNGSKGFVHHANALRIETRRAGEGDVYVLEYTPTELIQMWNCGKATWTPKTPRADHPIETTGTLVTMLGLGTGPNVNPKHPRTAERLVDELGAKLPTYVSRRVTIVDERGRSFKLKPRRLMGTKIEGEGRIEGIGSVSYELAVIPDPDAVSDRLDVWAMERVCDIRAFLEKIHPTAAMATLLRSVRTILDHPQVVGMIMMPGLNSMVGQDRKSFRQEFYDDDDLVFSVVRFLHEKILPEVEKNLGSDASKRMRSADDETMRVELVRHLQQIGGTPRTTIPTPDVDLGLLKVTPASLDLEPGDQVSPEIGNPKMGTIYRWDATRAGGTLDKKIGPKVTFTAGDKQGTFILVVNDGEHTLEIPINIVSELPFGFALRVRHAMPGQRITLRLINTRHTSGRFVWNDSESGGVLQVNQDTLSAEYEAGDTEAEFAVTVTEKDPPSSRAACSAKCTIYVTKRSETPEPRRPSDSVFRYPKTDGPSWELQFRVFTSPETAGVASYLAPGFGDRPHRITLNVGHPSYRDQPDRVQRLAALMQIALRMAQLLFKDQAALLSTPDEIADLLQQRASAILAEIVSYKTLPR